MRASPSAACWLAAAVSVGCAASQTLHIRTSEPAQIWLYGEQICANTPCEYRYEPQGCGWPRLMAANRFVLEAKTPDGREAYMGTTSHCDVPDDWSIEIPKAKPRQP